MSISVIVATYGSDDWSALANERAVPSTRGQGAHETIIYHDHEGTVASSRNDAAGQTTGDFLIYLDGDDEFAPGYVGAMERALEREGAVTSLLLTPAVQQIKKGRPGRKFFFPECDFRTGNWIVIGTLISRDLFNEVGGFEEHPHGLEDWQLWAKCAKAGARVVKVPDAVYKAHWNRESKHHVLSRDRSNYMLEYERARASVWG